ncbi:MAG: NAD(P)/FAD-dependent oxidoreductase [Acidobacteriota bacterium]|nr:MAG: NAD(P)/FAD-dependent oxidoreductase [Acidobacteriota bacterium]
MRSNSPEKLREFDAVIIGAGLAGLHTARRLSASGVSVLLVDRKEDIGARVHTTGIFVRKTFEDFDFPEGSLGIPISKVVLYSPLMRRLELESPAPEFRIGRMDVLYRSILADANRFGAEFLNGARFAGSVPDRSRKGGSLVRVEKKGVIDNIRTRVIIGADGVGSAVARDLGLDTNSKWIVGYEKVFTRSAGSAEPRLHCFLSAGFAPGYIAWIADDGKECHVGVGGYPDRFDPSEALSRFIDSRAAEILDRNDLTETESRGGRIPVGGILKRIANKRGLLIGDAAGAVSPLTAGGLDPCLRLSDFAAEAVIARTRTDKPKVLLNYSGDIFEKDFSTKLIMRAGLRFLKFDFQYEWFFRALSSSPGRMLARKIFFRRSSFPDVSSSDPRRKRVLESIDAAGAR